MEGVSPSTMRGQDALAPKPSMGYRGLHEGFSDRFLGHASLTISSSQSRLDMVIGTRPLTEHGAFFVAHVEDVIGGLRLMVAGCVGLEGWAILVDQRAALVFALPY